jgi:hypothetical protein
MVSVVLQLAHMAPGINNSLGIISAFNWPAKVNSIKTRGWTVDLQRNPRSQTSTQLTIFYNGTVNVFDNVSVEKVPFVSLRRMNCSIYLQKKR